MRADVLPAYPYSIYKDDDQITTFFMGFNKFGQDYIDSFLTLNLPIYNLKVGAFLDWVGKNIYGIPRPVFPVGREEIRGEINTVAYNEQALNELLKKYPQQYILASDDVYRRVITWHHWKGDGDVFNVRNLKRRVQRFLSNTRVDQTYQVSVSFGIGNQANLTIYNNGRMPLHPSAIIADGELNSYALNELRTEEIALVKYELAEIFRTAVMIGCLELPFQYDWVVTII